MKAVQISNLTPLRGLAAFMTMLFHANLYFGLLASTAITLTQNGTIHGYHTRFYRILAFDEI